MTLLRFDWRSAARAAFGVGLGCLAAPVAADDGTPIDGYGRIEGRYCAAAAWLVLDDGRQFETDAAFAPGTTVVVRGATLGPSLCGRAPRLAGTVVATPVRPAIVLTLPAREWPRLAGDVAALARRFPQARLRLNLLSVDADEAFTAVLQIGAQWLQQPDLMARSTIVPVHGAAARDAVRGWRVASDALDISGSVHADSADDVARLLAAVR